MASVSEWVAGARPRTLPASIAPVLAGTGLAWTCDYPTLVDRADSAWVWVAPILCLIVGAGMQIGSNFANDYSDGIRGTDDVRTGPMRLVGSGAASPHAVKRAAIISFALACLAGLIAVLWWGGWFDQVTWDRLSRGHWGVDTIVSLALLGVGAACLLGAWFYTGGKHPYGYRGLGEVFVFIFFGLVATIGTWYLVSPGTCAVPAPGDPIECFRYLPWGAAVILGAVMGFQSMAILVANNLRDIDTDKASGKITLPVRIGDRATRILYIGLLAASVLGIVWITAVTYWWAILGVLGIAVAVPSIVSVARGASGKALIQVLKMTGMAQLATSILLVAGLLVALMTGATP